MVVWDANPVRPNSYWSRKGNRQRETLCFLLSIVFNACLGAEAFRDDADLVLGGMVLARGAANVADQLFGWHATGWGGGLLAHLHSRWGYDEP